MDHDVQAFRCTYRFFHVQIEAAAAKNLNKLRHILANMDLLGTDMWTQYGNT